MKLTQFSDYSLRVLIFAALRREALFSVDEVARAYGVSRHHVAKVVNFLTREGYLESRRGCRGGIRLGTAAEQIRVGQVVRKTESGSVMVECFAPATNTCRLTQACLLKRALSQASTAFYDALDQYTLADLATPSTPLLNALEVQA